MRSNLERVILQKDASQIATLAGEGHDAGEIARMLGKDVGAVKSFIEHLAFARSTAKKKPRKKKAVEAVEPLSDVEGD